MRKTIIAAVAALAFAATPLLATSCGSSPSSTHSASYQTGYNDGRDAHYWDRGDSVNAQCSKGWMSHIIAPQPDEQEYMQGCFAGVHDRPPGGGSN
jgi:hypothetical protein